MAQIVLFKVPYLGVPRVPGPPNCPASKEGHAVGDVVHHLNERTPRSNRHSDVLFLLVHPDAFACVAADGTGRLVWTVVLACVGLVANKSARDKVAIAVEAVHEVVFFAPSRQQPGIKGSLLELAGIEVEVTNFSVKAAYIPYRHVAGIFGGVLEIQWRRACLDIADSDGDVHGRRRNTLHENRSKSVVRLAVAVRWDAGVTYGRIHEDEVVDLLLQSPCTVKQTSRSG